MKYKIKHVSVTNSIFTIAALISGFLLVFPPLVPTLHDMHGGIVLLIIIVLVFFVIGYFAWQKFVVGIAEWTIDKEGIDMEWIKQFSFHKGDGLNLKWDVIEYFQFFYHTSETSDLFKIKTNLGKTYRYYFSNTTNDDSQNFYKHLREVAEHHKIAFY